MNAEDDWEELPPSALALASVWPLVRGDRVNVHEDSCAVFEGGECCDCKVIRLDGPTGLA